MVETNRRNYDRGWGWVGGQILLMAICALLGRLYADSWPGWGHRIAAVVLTVLGAVFGIAGVCVLGRNRTIFPEPQPNSVLIQHGIYRWVRHPLYTSVMMLALAWGCWRSSLPALGGAGVLIMFLLWKVRSEEIRLLRRFAEYAEYQAGTRRFLPWIV